jgi:hypothetical protein
MCNMHLYLYALRGSLRFDCATIVGMVPGVQPSSPPSRPRFGTQGPLFPKRPKDLVETDRVEEDDAMTFAPVATKENPTGTRVADAHVSLTTDSEVLQAVAWTPISDEEAFALLEILELPEAARLPARLQQAGSLPPGLPRPQRRSPTLVGVAPQSGGFLPPSAPVAPVAPLAPLAPAFSFESDLASRGPEALAEHAVFNLADVGEELPNPFATRMQTLPDISLGDALPPGAEVAHGDVWVYSSQFPPRLSQTESSSVSGQNQLLQVPAFSPPLPRAWWLAAALSAGLLLLSAFALRTALQEFFPPPHVARSEVVTAKYYSRQPRQLRLNEIRTLAWSQLRRAPALRIPPPQRKLSASPQPSKASPPNVRRSAAF